MVVAEGVADGVPGFASGALVGEELGELAVHDSVMERVRGLTHARTLTDKMSVCKDQLLVGLAQPGKMCDIMPKVVTESDGGWDG